MVEQVTWGDVALTVVIATPAMGIFVAGMVWLFTEGTEPDRPHWQAALVGLALLAYLILAVSTLTKLTQDGVI